MRVSGRMGIVVAAAALTLGGAQAAGAQPQDPPAAAPVEQSRAAPSERAVDPSQPDFTLITLPTNLRMPKFASAFRVTHRFTRSLGQGNFGDLLSDAFGVDGGAQVGLEFRFGVWSGTQAGIHRTSDRTIQLFLQHQLLRQKEGMPITIDVLGAIDGTDNFRDSYSPSIGAVISRTFGRHGAAYVTPIWINNTNDLPSDAVDHNNTLAIGLGGRLRVRPTLYLLAEGMPRFGYTPNKAHLAFAIEKRAGGHSFQINFSNGYGTTLPQVARGGIDYDTWFLGFNISRKFF
jgi:uncharacterized beta barrel domain-containing protein DUF5777